MRFGLFLAPFHADPGQNPTLALHHDVELICTLERLGYDEAWVGEHHSGGTEIITSPEVFLGYAAARTSRIKLGAGVVSLPYHNPLWVADRAILLDHLTRGRFMLGIGPGLLSVDAAMIGVDPGAVRDILHEDFPVLMHLLRSDEPISIDTGRYQLVDARVHLGPYSDFEVALPSVYTPSGPLLAGRFGAGLLQLTGLTQEGMAIIPEHWRVMQEQAATHGAIVSRDDWRVVGIMHVADTRDQAIDEVRYGLMHYFDYLQGTIGGDRFTGAGSTFDSRFEWATSTGHALVGTPDDAIAKLGELEDKSRGGVGAFLFWGQEWASRTDTERSYELFARRVMPVFQDQIRHRAASLAYANRHKEELHSTQFAGAKRFIVDHADSASTLARTRTGVEPGADPPA
jgi:limonene 1,2-monooxygenase